MARMAYTEFGSGPPVILLHGLLGSRVNMGIIARKLADSFNVFTVDLRNHGDSFHDSSMNYESMVDDLILFMDGLDIHRAILIGHSMGGKCAMQAALSFPDRISSLVVVDIGPAPHDPDPVFDLWFEALLGLDINKITKRKDADNMLSRVIPSKVYRQFILQNLVRTNTNRYKWRINLKALAKNHYHICDGVKGEYTDTRTLFILGGASHVVTEKDYPGIKRRFPGSEIDIIKNTGHLVHFEAQQIFLQKVRQFLL